MIYEYRKRYFVDFTKVRWVRFSKLDILYEYDNGDKARATLENAEGVAAFMAAWASYAGTP